MNKILLFLCLVVSSLYYCQNGEATEAPRIFYINNKQVYWEKIFTTEKSLDNIKQILLTGGKIKINSESENMITGEINDFIMDFKGAGYTSMGTPLYLKPSSMFYANFTLKYKEGKYKVSVTNIRLKGDSMSIYSGGFGISDSGNDAIETYILFSDRLSFRPRFEGREASIINYSFSSLFNVENYKADNDW